MNRRLTKEWNERNQPSDNRFFIDSMRYSRGHTIWKIHLFIDAQTTAFRDAMLTIDMKFAPEYPFRPPSVVFVTPIFHPYVDTQSQEFCSCIMEIIKSNHGGYKTDVNTYLECIYEVILSDGSSYDNENICIQTNIQRTRNMNYMLFDSIVQRCLGRELPEDIRVEDKEPDEFSGKDLGEWIDQVKMQRDLNTIRLGMVSKLKLSPNIETMLNNYLGLVPGKRFDQKDELMSVHEIESVSTPTLEIRITTEDNVTKSVPKWSCIKLFDIDDDDEHEQSNQSLPLPNINAADIDRMLSVCRPGDAMTLRKLSPTVLAKADSEPSVSSFIEFIEPYRMFQQEETVSIIETADFLGADVIVKAACLHLSHLIRRESRREYEQFLSNSDMTRGEKRKSKLVLQSTAKNKKRKLQDGQFRMYVVGDVLPNL